MEPFIMDFSVLFISTSFDISTLRSLRNATTFRKLNFQNCPHRRIELLHFIDGNESPYNIVLNSIQVILNIICGLYLYYI